MRAIDTNVLVRFLANDDVEQAARAKEIIEGRDVYVATSVLLETEWVLRGAYAFERMRIRDAFEAFAGLPGVTVEDADLLAAALELTREGLDFADALHLARAAGCEAFVTFDRKLVKAAKGRGPVEAVLA